MLILFTICHFLSARVQIFNNEHSLILITLLAKLADDKLVTFFLAFPAEDRDTACKWSPYNTFHIFPIWTLINLLLPVDVSKILLDECQIVQTLTDAAFCLILVYTVCSGLSVQILSVNPKMS